MVNQAYNGNERVTLTPKRRKVVLASGEVTSENSGDKIVSDGRATSNGTAGTWAAAVKDNSGDNRDQPKTGRSHWRQKSLLVNGVSNDSSADKSFAADICLVAGGVSKNATADKLTEYLQNKGLDILKCELLTTKVELARTLSFKVTIKADNFEKAKDPNIWPYRVVVRKFVNFRKREIYEFAPKQK